MSEDKKQTGNKIVGKSGYQPIEKGYQPNQGVLDSSNPPQGGSGVPLKIQGKSSKADKQG